MPHTPNREPTLPYAVRRLLHFFWRLTRGVTLGVRAAVLDREGRVLLVRHTYVEGWHLPGGGVDPGETARAAVERELWEEARIEMAGEPELHGVYLNRNASNRDHVVLYVVRHFRIGEPKRTRDLEIAEAGFFSLSALPESTTRATRARLQEIVTGAAPPPTW